MMEGEEVMKFDSDVLVASKTNFLIQTGWMGGWWGLNFWKVRFPACMGHKCLRSKLFKIDEKIAFCDIPAEKLTLG
jgi:hypothetical protein